MRCIRAHSVSKYVPFPAVRSLFHDSLSASFGILYDAFMRLESQMLALTVKDLTIVELHILQTIRSAAARHNPAVFVSAFRFAIKPRGNRPERLVRFRRHRKPVQDGLAPGVPCGSVFENKKFCGGLSSNQLHVCRFGI